MKIETKIDLEQRLHKHVKQRIKDRINERMQEHIKNYQNKNKTQINHIILTKKNLLNLKNIYSTITPNRRPTRITLHTTPI